MRVLIVGGGGREHALAWKIARSPRCDALFCAPGNPGVASVARCVPIAVSDLDGLRSFCRTEAIELVVVGPEQPLVDGLADRLREDGVAVFGPDAAPARLEGSKAFAKDFMRRHGVPTAGSRVFEDGAALRAFLAECPLPTVVKADGLAAGKGVFVCHDRAQAVAAGEEVGRFGASAASVLVEDFMAGEEASVFALVDGDRVLVLPPSQDHKRRFEGDEGPNTGGMGAYCPVPAVDAALMDRVLDEVLLPVARGLVAEGTPYRGLLYAGLMLCEGGPKVVEFNCRFGDPETQPVLFALESDLLPLLDATARGRLDEVEPPRARPGSTCCVVLVSDGYPGPYDKGLPIEGLPSEDRDDLVVFHAGTRLGDDGSLVTAGGRVLGVTAHGATIEEARATAYEAIAGIHWPGMSYRTDIAARAATGRSR